MVPEEELTALGRLVALQASAFGISLYQTVSSFKGANVFSKEQLDDLVKRASHNTNSDTTVLGKWSVGDDSYINVAKSQDASYFDLGNDGWNNASEMVGGNEAEMWRINQQYLDQQIAKGSDFIFSHEPNISSPYYNGFYKREIQYLTEVKGYTIVQEGKYWYAYK